MGTGLVKFDATKIETALYNFFQPKLVSVCDLIMSGSRNMAINQASMVYFNAPLDIVPNSEELDLGKTIVRIEIYAEKLGGFKNGSKLSEIRDLIVAEIQDGVTLDGHSFDYKNEINGDDRAGYDYIFLNLATLIL